MPELVAWVAGLGVWGPVAFVAIYALAVVLWVPGSLLTLCAGAFFDLLAGSTYVFVGATLGSAMAFLIARYLARARVERWLAHDQRYRAIDRGIARQGFKIVFLLRLSPLVPFTPLNFVLGLTRVRFSEYLAASPGMIPATVLYVYYGKVVGDVAALAGGALPERGPGDWLLLGLGLVATGAATWVVTRAARRALAEEIEDGAR